MSLICRPKHLSFISPSLSLILRSRSQNMNFNVLIKDFHKKVVEAYITKTLWWIQLKFGILLHVGLKIILSYPHSYPWSWGKGHKLRTLSSLPKICIKILEAYIIETLWWIELVFDMLIYVELKIYLSPSVLHQPIINLSLTCNFCSQFLGINFKITIVSLFSVSMSFVTSLNHHSNLKGSQRNWLYIHANFWRNILCKRPQDLLVFGVTILQCFSVGNSAQVFFIFVWNYKGKQVKGNLKKSN